MHGKVTDEEWEIFRQAYIFFSEHCDPPANSDCHALDWWTECHEKLLALDMEWSAKNPLMRSLLLAIEENLDFKARERTEELSEFLP